MGGPVPVGLRGARGGRLKIGGDGGLKRHCHGVFSAIFNKAVLKVKPWLSTILLIQETYLGHQEKISSKILNERRTIIHFKLLFSSQNGQT